MRTSNVRLSGSYRKGILFFLLLMLAVVLVVLYFTLTRAIITITPHVRQVETEFFLDVADQQSPDDGSLVTHGTIEQKIIEKSDTFASSGTKTIEPTIDGDTLGTVVLINNLDKKVDLVRKTRLLSEDNTLLRLNDDVTIPPLGHLETRVYADAPEKFVMLDIGRLSIPGLSKAMQENVYAENRTKISKEKQVINVIEKKDVEDAVVSLSNRMRQEAINDIKMTYGEEGPVVLAFVSEVVEKTVDKPVGSEGSEFTANVKMKVVSVFLDKSEVFKLIDSKLRDSLKNGERVERLDYDKTKYIIENYDLDNKTAHIKVQAVAQVKMDSNHPILNKEKIVGANKEQVSIYFKSFDEVQDVDVMFTPFWVHKVPSMLDKIQIKVR